MLTSHVTPETLETALQSLEAGSPIPDEYRRLFAASLRENRPLEIALAVHALAGAGYGLHESGNGAYVVAGAHYHVSSSSARRAYSRYRDLLD